jgi:hypothetical protein
MSKRKQAKKAIFAARERFYRRLVRGAATDGAPANWLPARWAKRYARLRPYPIECETGRFEGFRIIESPVAVGDDKACKHDRTVPVEPDYMSPWPIYSRCAACDMAKGPDGVWDIPARAPERRVMRES